jgi:hypothetical protein
MSSWGDRATIKELREALELIARGGIDIEKARQIAKDALRKQ